MNPDYKELLRIANEEIEDLQNQRRYRNIIINVMTIIIILMVVI
jgi:hypothetical protein